jgi:TPR repeat protein
MGSAATRESDQKASVKWILRAASGGDPDAQARACEVFRLGKRGVIAKNDNKCY